MTKSEIKELSTEELLERIQTEKENYGKLKLNHRITEIENPMDVRSLRKTVARLKTELRRRQLEDSAAK